MVTIIIRLFGLLLIVAILVKVHIDYSYNDDCHASEGSFFPVRIEDNGDLKIGTQTVTPNREMAASYVNVDHKFIIYFYVYLVSSLVNLIAKFAEFLRKGKRISKAQNALLMFSNPVLLLAMAWNRNMFTTKVCFCVYFDYIKTFYDENPPALEVFEKHHGFKLEPDDYFCDLTTATMVDILLSYELVL